VILQQTITSMKNCVKMFSKKLYLIVSVVCLTGCHSFPNSRQIEVEERDTDKPMDATKAVSFS
jgi:uncharacterized lipoprotein YajG